MIFAILLILKLLPFMNITNVEHNRMIIFSISALIILFIFSLIHFTNLKRKRIIGFIIYGIISLIMFVDVMYFSYFNCFPSVRMIKQFHQLGAVTDSIRMLLSFKNLLFILDLPLLIILFRKRPSIFEGRSYNGYIRFFIPAGIALTLILTLSIVDAKGLMVPVKNQEPFTYHIMDIKEVFSEDAGIAEGIHEVGEAGRLLTQEDLQELLERTQLKEGKHTGIGKGKNLIVIQVEALQNFVIDLFYDGQEVTPNLNKLIKEKGSLYFDNYYQQLGRGNTSDAEFVTNNSLYPSMEEPTYVQYEQNTFYGLPWVLRDNGYTAWVFHGYEKDFWNRDKAYVNQGFQRFISQDDYKLVETIGFGITDEEFFKQSMEYLKELDSIDDNPFYAFMITLTSHTPFKMPKKYQHLKIREEHEDTILGDYLQAIHYTDKAIGNFIDKLKEEGLYEDTVIALYGDHFAITGYNPQGVELMSDFLDMKYDINEMFRVPLIIHVPGTDINETISRIGSQLDFMPTILNIMGYKNEKGIMMGRDLLNYEGKNFVAAQIYLLKGTFIDDDTLFYMSSDGLFENSKAYNRQTREPIPLEKVKERYEYVIAEINKSNYILKKDLIKLLMENQGSIDLATLKGENIPDDQYIIRCYNDPLEELSQNYEKGHRLMAVKIKFTAKEDVVLVSDHKLKDLANWMEEHPDAYIFIKTDEENKDIFLKVKDMYPQMMNRLVLELTKFDQHYRLTNKAYKNIIFNASKANYTKEEILDFLRRNPLNGIVLDERYLDEAFIEELKKLEVSIYLDEVDEEALAQYENIIDGFLLGP